MSGERLSNNTGENQEKVLDPRVESLAIPLARDYAEKNYPIREDGTFEPAWRGVNNEGELRGKSPEALMKEGWSDLAAHEAVIDLANQPYNEYSEYWKEQNRGGAKFLIGLMDEFGADALKNLDLEDEEVRNKFGDLIHKNWLERNDWVSESDERSKPFVELSPEQQKKDIDQLGVLQKWIIKQEREQAQGKLEKALDALDGQISGRQTSDFSSLEDWAKYLISDVKLDPGYVVENYEKIRDAVVRQQGSLESDKGNHGRWENGHDLLAEELLSHMYNGPKLTQEDMAGYNSILDENYERRVNGNR